MPMGVCKGRQLKINANMADAMWILAPPPPVVIGIHLCGDIVCSPSLITHDTLWEYRRLTRATRQGCEGYTCQRII